MRCPSARTFVAAIVTAVLTGALAAQVPSPRQFLGHDIGEDHYLCNYTDLVRYFRAIAAASDRVTLREIGKTSWGQTMVMAVITSPQNRPQLEQYRATARRLCLARDLDQAAAKELARTGKAVVWIDAGLHATECIAGQNIIELVWRMASGTDAETLRILDQVILLACPVNPDGLELIADAYGATQSTSTPVLYQRYVGHDNNRDFYICNQLEATNVNRIFYQEWFPQIVYNHHQTAPAGTIIFTPPFRDPFNYYADPLVMRGIDIVAAHMNTRFARENKPGAISRSGAPYSGWWNGGLRSTTYFHNIIGILTESFGRPEPVRITQPLNRRLPYGDYPDPVPSQLWHPAQTIEYLQTANFAVLDYAARCKEDLLFGIWRMGRNGIDRGSADHWTVTPRMVEAAQHRADQDSVFTDPLLRDPRAYVLRSDQPDFADAVRLVQALQKNGIEVLAASAPFAANGVTFPAGSLVIKTAQAFRPHVLDMFEPQWHPDDLKDGKPVPPYDAAGWTLALQFDVHVDRCFDDLQGPFAPLPALATFPPREVAAAPAGWQIDPRCGNAVLAINRLLRDGVAVLRSQQSFTVPAAAGALAKVQALGRELGVRFPAVDAAAGTAGHDVKPPRVGLFDVFGGNMPTGWDQWLLEQYGFAVHQVWGARVVRGELRRDFDVLVFHTGLPGGRDLTGAGGGPGAAQNRSPETLAKLAAALPPFEDWSNLQDRAVRLTGENALPALKEFVEQGGTLIALGGECDKVVRHWNLPVKVGTFVQDAAAEGGERRTRREEFYIPGSLVALEVDTQHPVAAGTSMQVATMFNAGSPVFEVTGPGVEVIARYRQIDTLVSGWAIGEEYLAGKAAVVAAKVGKGRILLYGADVTYRGQPLGSAKLFFHGILTAVGPQ